MAVASAWGYSDTFPTVTQEFAASKFVFVGRVLSTKEIAVKSESITGGTFYTLEVSDVLKGKLPHRVRLYSENSSGRFPMVVGKRYLIFTDYSIFEGIRGWQLAVNSCGNSGPFPKANDTLTIVRKLSKTPSLSKEHASSALLVCIGVPSMVSLSSRC